MFGWGAHCLDITANGEWSEDFLSLHINFPELKAVSLALLQFLPALTPAHLLIRSDNTTVVAYLNNQGDTHSPEMSLEVENLLIRLDNLGFSLAVKHVAGSCNVLAEQKS